MINIIKIFGSFIKNRKERNGMAVMTKRGSAFVVDSLKVDSFLNQKSSKRNVKVIKNRANALRKILKDDTKKR